MGTGLYSLLSPVNSSIATSIFVRGLTDDPEGRGSFIGSKPSASGKSSMVPGPSSGARSGVSPSRPWSGVSPSRPRSGAPSRPRSGALGGSLLNSRLLKPRSSPSRAVPSGSMVGAPSGMGSLYSLMKLVLVMAFWVGR